MDFAIGLLIFCACCAGVAVYRGLTLKRREYRRLMQVGASTGMRITAPHTEVGSMQWIRAAELSEWFRTDALLTVIRLVDEESPADLGMGIDEEIPVTLTQLEEGFPWMMGESRIVIYRMGGISSKTAHCLARIVAGKKVYLLLDDSPSTPVTWLKPAEKMLEL